MQGKLSINLEPAYIGFETESKVSRLKYCKPEEIRNLLVDLGILPALQNMPRREFVVNLQGDFPVEVLSKYGLSNLGLIGSAGGSMAVIKPGRRLATG